MSTNDYDLMIVGIGPAGLTAALYARQLGMSVVALGDVPGGNLFRIDNITNYPGFPGGVAGAKLGVSFYSQAQMEGAVFPLLNVSRLQKTANGFSAIDSNDQQYEARAVIVACGQQPKTLDVPNANLEGIYYCALCDGPIFRDQDVALAVIGGGNMAGQQALSLANFVPKVYLIHRGEKLRMQDSFQKAVQANQAIEVLLNRQVLDFEGDKQIEGLKLAQGEQTEVLPVNGIFQSIGWKVTLDMLDFSLETVSEGHIKTDQTLMSSVPGLFAAGDVRDTDLHQIVTACGDGARAANNVFFYLQEQ